MLQWADAYVEEVAGRIAEAGGDGIAVERRVLGGAVGDTLLDHADDVDADLVVMTTHGRGSLARMWLGSVTDAFLRRSGRPVLVSRPEHTGPVDLREPSFPGRILVALDSVDENHAALKASAELARATGATLRLLRVVETPHVPFTPESTVVSYAPENWLEEARADLESLASRLRDGGLEVEAVAKTAEGTARGILDDDAAWPAELVVMGTGGKGMAARLVLGSVSDKVVRAADSPVLVVPG